MNNFKNILYVWHHDVSLGDSLTNFHAHLCSLKHKHPNSIIHVIIHPRTYNTDVHTILTNKGIIDFVYPIELDRIENNVYRYFNHILKNINFDIVLHNVHTDPKMVGKFKTLFPNALHLETFNSKFGLTKLSDYTSVSENTKQFNTILKTSYNTNYIDKFISDVLSLSNDKKTVGLFVGSTRKLANVHSVGLSKIVNTINKFGYYAYLLGTKSFNPYATGDGIDWRKIYQFNNENCYNLVGNNWIKTINLIQKLDCVISSPTGASMIPPLINKKQLLILGGDSPIMESCLTNYTNLKDTSFSRCNCVNYPCRITDGPKGTQNGPNSDLIKYNKCESESDPYCLNEDINLEDIEKFLVSI